MISEREAALHSLQECELLQGLLSDRFHRSKVRLDDAFKGVADLKERFAEQGINTLGARKSPEPSCLDSGFEVDRYPDTSATDSSRSCSPDSDRYK